MIEIYCIRGNGDKEMNSVEDKLLSSMEMAIRRGKYEIDKQWYLIHNQSIETPFKKSDSGNLIVDNDIIEISDANSGICGKKRIRSVTISGTPSEIGMQIQIADFKEFL